MAFINLLSTESFFIKVKNLTIQITDNAYIDGKWVLAEYDQKIKRLSINLKEENIGVGDHDLELNVKDEKNNTNKYNKDKTKDKDLNDQKCS